jgi:hypothetical protein
MTVTLILAERRWMCPNCPTVDVTHEAQPHTRFHTCPGLLGLTAPMIESGQRVKVSAVEREDYIGTEQVQTNAAGRPIMSVVTEREDGSNDVTVFAPTANGKAEEL